MNWTTSLPSTVHVISPFYLTNILRLTRLSPFLTFAGGVHQSVLGLDAAIHCFCRVGVVQNFELELSLGSPDVPDDRLSCRSE